MFSILTERNTFELIYSIVLLIMNFFTFILSLLLIILNIVKENNKNLSLMLSINYQISLVCILHSISFILYPFNTKETEILLTIEGVLAIVSYLVLVNLVGSLLIYYYVILKAEIRKKYSLSVQLSSTWVLPIIFGIVYYLFGIIELDEKIIFEWEQKVEVLDTVFFALYLISLTVCFIYLFKLRFEMKKLAKSSKSYKTIMFSIIIYFIALMSCVLAVLFNILSYFVGHDDNSGSSSSYLYVVFKYSSSFIENILVLYFCWFCGYESTKRQMFLELFCCKKVETKKEDDEEINISLIINELEEEE